MARGHAAIGTYRTRPSPGLEALDLSGDVAGFLTRRAPSLVILTAALTNVDYCESHAQETRERNLDQLRPVVEWCAASDVPLVFFSTDYLFDGAHGPYAEDAAPAPLNVYGRSKLEGERTVAAVPRHAILRVTNVFNLGDDVKNFLYRVVTTLRDGRTLELASDQLATPTYAPWLATHGITLLERGALCATDSPRVLNVGCDELLSRVDFARRIAVALGADPGLVVGRTTAELRQAAPRPLRGGLRNDRLKRLLGVSRISFDEALADLLPRMRELYGAAAAS